MRSAVLLFATALCAAPLAAQSSSAAFITVQGRDTVSLEEYARSGNTITGTWVAIHTGVFTHRYVLTLGADGMPAKYVMDYTVEGEALAPGQLRTVTITYGPDTATIVLLGDTAATRRFAMHGAVPVLGRSVVGFEIALGRFRAAHADTATIVIESPTGPQFGAVKMPVRMAGPDSILIAGVVYAQLAQDGRLLQMVAGPAQTRRVDPYDMNKLIAEFTAVETPKRAAALAAAASRVEITLPAEVLDRLAGTYALNATASMIVKRDGDKFLAQVAPQPALQLFAQSPTTFFLKGVDVQIEFEVDASGNGTALTIIQNGARQRAVRAKQ